MSGYINLLSIIVSVLVLLYILNNQRRVRQVHQRLGLRLPIILVVLGIFSASNYLNSHPPTTVGLILLVFSLIFLAGGLGTLRAYTVRIWSNDKGVFRQGTWLTIGLWIVSVALHVLIEQVSHTGESSLLLYYGITFGVQRVVVNSRVKPYFEDIPN